MIGPTRPQRRRYPDWMYESAAFHLSRDPRPSGDEIADRLREEAAAYAKQPGATGKIATTPDGRTVRTWIEKGWIARTRTERFSIGDAPAGDIPLVLGVMRAVAADPFYATMSAIDGKSHPAPRPTAVEAEWIAKIRRAYPDLQDLGLVNWLAVRASRGGSYLATVELALMYEIWTDGGKALVDAVEAGHVVEDVVAYAALTVLNMDEVRAERALERREAKR